MLFPQNGKKAGLYLRLSRDELVGRESNSIANQRMILTEYAQKNGLTVVDEYPDDGVSGTTFERPSFQKMMEDIKSGRIDTVIVKDLSRLGRDYLGTGEHIENIFPKLGVRFISIYENYDSLTDSESADFLPYINLCNERHAKQSGRKSKDTKDHMAAAGKFIGSKAPFGYILDPADKHHLLIDLDAAESVRLIFQYACDGLGYKAIARRLRARGVLNPTAYNNIKFPTHHKSEYWRQPHDWHESSIKSILTNPTYLGKIVSGRRRKPSFRSKEIVNMPEEAWITVEGMHEPIIDQHTWSQAQEKLKSRKRCDNQGAQQIFAGLAKCYDCGYALNYTYNKGNPRYQCSLYSTKGKGHCSSHFITYDDLYNAVLHDIQRRAKAAANMDSHLLARLSDEAAGILGKRARQAEKECARMNARIDELEAIIAKLYEDSALGHISAERCRALMDKFEQEQRDLKRERDEMTVELEAQRKRQSEMAVFTKVIAGYQELTELNATMLNELVSEIRVGSKYTADGIKKQTIKIVYKHECYVDYFDDGDLTPSTEAMTELEKLETAMSKKRDDAPMLPEAV